MKQQTFVEHPDWPRGEAPVGRSELKKLRAFVQHCRELAKRNDGTAYALRIALVPLKERTH